MSLLAAATPEPGRSAPASCRVPPLSSEGMSEASPATHAIYAAPVATTVEPAAAALRYAAPVISAPRNQAAIAGPPAAMMPAETPPPSDSLPPSAWSSTKANSLPTGAFSSGVQCKQCGTINMADSARCSKCGHRREVR
eukprot:TRINITY_DN32208_c0_g1_i1.p1 TRINITY_DN32208_c0_g1~~TRINITY_DN32208_c0_g1_i1.p1  ORF type:complete len:150 (+),score=22.94 TRINITY_DN32208_c0_g1_i1:35-451(+)